MSTAATAAAERAGREAAQQMRPLTPEEISRVAALLGVVATP